MGVHRLDDECYGVMAERYLKTVIEYLEDESIQKYAFSTILWYRLRADLFKMRRRSIKVGDPLPIDTCARTIGQSDEPGIGSLHLQSIKGFRFLILQSRRDLSKIFCYFLGSMFRCLMVRLSGRLRFHPVTILQSTSTGWARPAISMKNSVS